MKYPVALALLLISLIFSGSLFAQQTGGGGGNDGLKGVCELAGGSWTGSESGNWACCWADWGCYGCVNSICKMQCRTDRCRKANAMAKSNSQQKVIKGLAPAGMKSPIIPKNAKPEKNPEKMQIN